MNYKIIGILFILLICLGTANAALTDNIVSYYNFDETSGTTLFDELGTNNLTTTNVTINQTGKINQAIVTTAEKDTGIGYLGDISTSFWVKSNNTAVEFAIPLTSDTYNQGIFRVIDSTTIEFFTIARGVAGRYDTGNLTVPNLSTNWLYVNMRYEVSTNTFYWQYNNTSGSGNAGLLNGISSARNISLGVSNNAYFDELGIWDRVLTTDEITELYNSGSGLTYPFTIESVDANFDYTIDQTNAEIDLNDTSTATDTTIDGWSWDINGVTRSTDQNFTFDAIQNTDYNVCLTIDNNDNTLTDTNCQIISTGTWYVWTTTNEATLNGVARTIDYTSTSSVTYSTITGYEWLVNGVSKATTQNFTLTGITDNTDYNACILTTATGSDSNTYIDSNCQTTSVGDITAPTTTITTNQVSGTTDQNIVLTCTDSNSGCAYINFRINGGDWNYYSIGDNPLTIDFTTTDNNIYYYSSDFNDNNEATKFSYFPMFSYQTNQAGSFINFYGVSKYNGYDVTTYQYQIDGVTKSTDQNFTFYTSANLDLNVCLTVNSIDTYCRSVITWDTIFPTISVETNFVPGFSATPEIDYNMICYDNFTTVTYKIVKNDTNTLYDSLDANASLKSDTIAFGSNEQIGLDFSCTDSSGNVATYSTEKLYSLTFNLINEETGAQYTCTDLNTNFDSLQVYSSDGNFNYDFNADCVSTKTFFGSTNDMIFEIGYYDADNTKIFRYMDFGLISDANIPICVPEYQTFYLQQFLSGSPREIILYNNIAKCYSLSGSLVYAASTQYAQNVYTIAKPYQLFAWVNGAKVSLIGIDGSQSNQFNLDSIIFSQAEYNYNFEQDNIVFQQKLNPLTNKYDLNIVQILYKSFEEDNTSFNIDIYLNDTLYYNYYDINSPNNEIIEFYWGAISNVTDENFFKIVLTLEKENGTTDIITNYVNIAGSNRNNIVDPGIAVLVSILFFGFGISLASTGREMGLFGVIVCVIAMIIASLSLQYWWVQLIEIGYLLCLFFIFVMGKPRNPQGGFN